MHRFISTIGAAAALTWVTLGAACTSHEASAWEEFGGAAPTADVVDEDALATVKAAARFLADAESLHVVTETGFDVVQSDGQKIEFGATREIALRRPDRARIESSRRDGKQAVVVFDGEDIWVYSRTQNAYAHTEQPGGIDESIEFLIEELGVTLPLADLFSTDVGSTLAEGLRSCYVVGESIVSGATCDHVALRNDYCDYQMWIARGEQPLLRRLVITYREEPGEPQFWADFREWKVGAVDADRFVFRPPEGSERIFFESTGSPAPAPDEEER